MDIFRMALENRLISNKADLIKNMADEYKTNIFLLSDGAFQNIKNIHQGCTLLEISFLGETGLK